MIPWATEPHIRSIAGRWGSVARVNDAPDTSNAALSTAPPAGTKKRSSRPGRKRGREGAAPKGPRATLGELLPYLFEQKALLTVIIVLSLLGAITSLAQPLIVGQVITRVGDAEPLGWLIWGIVVLVLFSALFNSTQHYLLQRMGEGVVLSSRRTLIAKILHLPISEFDQRRTGDLVSRIGSDTTLLRAVLTQGLVEVVGGALMFIGALIAMLIIDPVLFAITFGVLLVALLLVLALGSRIGPAVARSQEKVGDLAASVDRAISSIRTIRAAGATEREAATITEQAESAYGYGLKVARISAFIVPVSFIALQVSFLAVLGAGGYRVATGTLEISSLVVFLIFLFMLVQPLGLAFGAINAANQALGALGRIQEITRLSTETEHDAEIAAATPEGRIVPLEVPTSGDVPAIELDNVHFTYRSAAPFRLSDVPEGSGRRAMRDYEAAPAEIIETRVLKGVTFAVPRGARVALVGPSGAGKSTVLGLIERFYDPDEGSLSLHGTDLRALDRQALRAQIGYVEQDTPILAGTLRDNLLIGAPDASDAACTRVLEAVNLGSILTRDGSQGLDTQVGEDGIMLSGGEKQRLAIARALLTAPPILLLDESTASLDGVNERLMREALDSVATGRTLVVIAHRLSTVVDSDLIVVLDGGEVIGQGTHSELVEQVPLYRELAQHQLLVPADTDA